MERIDQAWAVSLLVAGVSAILLGLARLTGAQMPDVAVRVIGGLDLPTLPVLACTTVQKVRRRGRQSKK